MKQARNKFLMQKRNKLRTSFQIFDRKKIFFSLLDSRAASSCTNQNFILGCFITPAALYELARAGLKIESLFFFGCSMWAANLWGAGTDMLYAHFRYQTKHPSMFTKAIRSFFLIYVTCCHDPSAMPREIFNIDSASPFSSGSTVGFREILICLLSLHHPPHSNRHHRREMYEKSS